MKHRRRHDGADRRGPHSVHVIIPDLRKAHFEILINGRTVTKSRPEGAHQGAEAVPASDPPPRGESPVPSAEVEPGHQAVPPTTKPEQP
jgi:hypothetical protein